MFPVLQLFILGVFILDGHFLDGQFINYTSFYCSESNIKCPNGDMIQYPFYFEFSLNDYDCGYLGLSAKCSEGGRPFITLSNHSYYYQLTGDQGVRLMDMDAADQICPQPKHNFSLEGVVASSLVTDGYNVSYFYNCTTLPENVSPNLQCIDDNNNTTGSSFAAPDYNMPQGFNWYGNCQENVVVPVIKYYSHANYVEAIKDGIQLWLQPTEYCQNCENSGGKCTHKRNSNNSSCTCHGMLFDRICPQYSSKVIHSKGHGKIILILGLFLGFAGSLLILLLIYRKKHSETSPTNVEVFLESYTSHVLQRFKYSDIKKMTNSFKCTLGQGGFGSVFKGKLPNGRMVAVKLLNKSKGDGEDFINEVTTIGRTNHVNIVTLIGFCTEGIKRALVYEYMVNGSLEKFIYKKKSSIAYSPALGWDKLYQISLGIARGLEYLHRGCNNRILHFDIKPHNILLDSKLIPKISDFGLAKLSQTRDSIVSMVGTRGTRGYIAPEIYCRNFGVVSYKADVYSYGMMLFEMIGGRKNIDTSVENISEIYFPQWIYNHFNQEKKIEGSEDMQIDVSKDILQDEIARKMIIAALWCIQAHPSDRPYMNKVVEMLEATNEKLQMPPNPFLHPSSDISPLL